MQRDSQRSKVYRAEERAFGSAMNTHENGTRELSLEEMQALVDRWRSSKVLRRHYPKAQTRIRVTDGRGKRHACCHVGRIEHRLEMPRFARTKPALLHEFAHALAPRRVQHGWEFAEVYLYVVRVFMSKSAEERLKAEFSAGKVRHRPKRTRQISEADRQRARERMQALNAARRG